MKACPLIAGISCFAFLLSCNVACRSTSSEETRERLATRQFPPSVRIDPVKRTVTLTARATAVDETDPIEFFLIPASSGKDYEALATIEAKPSDVHAALLAVGLVPGHPTRLTHRQLWPRGERVTMTFTWEQSGQTLSASAGQLIIDTRTTKPPADDSLVFTGSYVLPAGSDRPHELFAADVSDSQSIASTYNDPTTVLDVPRRAQQSDVYGMQIRNPAYKWSPGQSLTITLSAADPTQVPVPLDCTMRISKNADDGATFQLIHSSGESIAGLHECLKTLRDLETSGREVFVHIQVDPEMQLGDVRSACAALLALEDSENLRLEPPPEGSLIYDAFFPEEAWRDRSRRLSPAREVFLQRVDSGIVLDPADQHWMPDENGPAKIPASATPPTNRGFLSASDLKVELSRRDTDKPLPLLVYAPADMRYQQLTDVLAGPIKSGRIIYIFLPARPATLPARDR